MQISEKRLRHLILECERLRDENQKLRELLGTNNISITNSIPASTVSETSKLRDEKIKDAIYLFKSLFHGRSDTYAVRWEAKNGKSGYAPACQNEWQANLCNKPAIKCSECENRRLLPLTDHVIFEHLSGKKTIGLYPLLKDETCWFLAIDFDKKDWQIESIAFINTCKRLGVHAYLERSRSGNGGHVWIFFNQAVSASLARKFGHYLITKTRYETKLQLASYDRLFPNQDLLTKGKFGNLIALPLQGSSKNQNNSVFVDEHFTPFPDQWRYLSTIKRMSKSDLEKIVSQKTFQEPIISWIKETETQDKLNNHEPVESITTLKLIHKNGILIKKDQLPLPLLQQIKELAIFNNPNYFKAKAQRFSTNTIPRKIDCSEEENDNLILPRGCLEDIKNLLKKQAIQLEIEDQLFKGQPLTLNFEGNLHPQQDEALKSLLANPIGILSATTGFGKTVIASALIAQRQTNTLVLVHRKPLIDQWKKSLTQFLSIDEKQIGQIGGGKQKPTGIIDVATIQSLNRHDEVKDFVKNYGQVIVDECHHISAYSFEKVLKKVEAQFVVGLTATPTRKDGLHPIMQMQLGSIRYRVKAKKQAKIRPFEHILIPRYTQFKSKNKESSIQELYNELIKNKNRNDLIFDDVLKELDNGSTPLILTERIEHIEDLVKRFKGFAKNIIVLKGGMKKSEEKERLRQLASLDHEEHLIIATGKYIGEGFDHARLDSLFLTMPLSWKGTLEQYVGRLHRLHENKSKVKVYDYVDHKEPMLQKMFEKRLKGYQSLGYQMANDNTNTTKNHIQMELF
ncbi:DEAD/DEAH box helicase family protein [Pullulanibacillus sp. KACC 23026]|uniref:TOTE conflict system archaeo-eukaryotic primase domain-containing protein n=1 Tax=Pullulanibacillus sp. KACC 23026 TaxID=3028315 RepID=UPI0023AFCE7A|nr:DEAD/DEAH box helicase [Pullulanibacillus sp. KACC 23026]WEG11280.1 DEAD/DEAH box helicase family protein [Pullulanibacillus sp. KACC 23026]